MKKDYRKLVLSLDADTHNIPGRINAVIEEFGHLHAKHAIFEKGFFGHWNGMQFNCKEVHVHKDDAHVFRQKYPKYF